MTVMMQVVLVLGVAGLGREQIQMQGPGHILIKGKCYLVTAEVLLLVLSVAHGGSDRREGCRPALLAPYR